MMKRNPFLGMTVDPYHGAEWIDTNLPIPDVSRHTLPPQGFWQQPQVEARGANVRSTHHVPPPSVSMVSTATSATPGEGTASHHNDHSVADTLVGIAAVAGATYAVKRAADAYIGNSRERYLRWMRFWTAIYCVFLVLPFVAMAVLFTSASMLWLSTPFLLILGVGWAMVPSTLRRRFPAWPSPIQATYHRP